MVLRMNALIEMLSAASHIRFAERWLVRLEHELSQRAKHVTAFQSKAGDLIAGQGHDDVQVVYGESGSAAYGGINMAPRHGAGVTAPKLHAKASRDRNVWKHWKAAFSHPIHENYSDIALQPHATHASSVGDIGRDKSGSEQSVSQGKTPSLRRSRSFSKARELAQRGLRSSDKTKTQEAPPPLPTLGNLHGLQSRTYSSATQKVDAPNGIRSHHRKIIESESSDKEVSSMDTQDSMSSQVSTAATSFGAVSHMRRVSSPSSVALHATKSPITTEVLMAADVPNFQPGQALRPVPVKGVLSKPPPRRSSMSSPTKPSTSPTRPPRSSSRQSFSARSNDLPSDVPRDERDDDDDRVRGELVSRGSSTYSGESSSSNPLLQATSERHLGSSSSSLTRPSSSTTVGPAHGRALAQVGALDQLSNVSELKKQFGPQTSRLSQSRSASIGENALRFGTLTLEDSTSSAFEYHKSLSPRPRSARPSSSQSANGRPRLSSSASDKSFDSRKSDAANPPRTVVAKVPARMVRRKQVPKVYTDSPPQWEATMAPDISKLPVSSTNSDSALSDSKETPPVPKEDAANTLDMSNTPSTTANGMSTASIAPTTHNAVTPPSTARPTFASPSSQSFLASHGDEDRSSLNGSTRSLGTFGRRDSDIPSGTSPNGDSTLSTEVDKVL